MGVGGVSGVLCYGAVVGFALVCGGVLLTWRRW